MILDPFSGSGTTGIAASLLSRRFLGLEREEVFLEMSKLRRIEIEDIAIYCQYQDKIFKYTNKPLKDIYEIGSPEPYYGQDLPIE